MGRLRLGAPRVALLLVALAGCTTEEKEDEHARWVRERRERVEHFMLHLNNANVEEAHRNGLIKVAGRSDEDRGYVLEECKRAYEESLAGGGGGTGLLRAPGRRRVMEVVAALPRSDLGLTLLKAGLKDGQEVRVAAAAGLAAWGDESALPVLIEVVGAAAEGSPEQGIGQEALRRLATPARRETYLARLSAANKARLAAVAARTFPAEPGPRRAALREVALDHANPHARVLALELMVADKDPGAAEVARRGLESGIPELRPTALAALGAAGGDEAVSALAALLASDPPYAAEVVRGLFEVGSARAHEQAVSAFADKRRALATRAALGLGFFARLAEPGAPAAYKAEAAREQALRALRAALDEREEPGREPLLAAAVEALGRIGEWRRDVEPIRVLLEEGVGGAVGPAAVMALGRLGGDAAISKLMELLARNAPLRQAAAEALAQLKSTRGVPVDDLLDLLDHQDATVRQAAFTALLGLSGGKDRMGYDPRVDSTLRRSGLLRWRKWWASAKSGG